MIKFQRMTDEQQRKLVGDLNAALEPAVLAARQLCQQLGQTFYRRPTLAQAQSRSRHDKEPPRPRGEQ